MPSIDRSDGLWVDEMDGPERLERAKKRRFEQLKRWEVRESTSNDEPESKRSYRRTVNFVPNIVMLEAAARNDLDEVARLLESGVSPDLANEDGLTALHQSCIDGCDDMVKYLIEHKANVNACDNERWTPLHAAAACGHLSIIKYLLKNGGNILALNLDGNLPAGVVEDDKEVETFLDKEMLKLGYDEAAIEELRLNEGKELLDDLKDSVAKGRSLDLQDEDGATAFHVAAANGWTNVVDFLLENEADFDIADNDGWQPIHAAAAWGHDTIIESLVASGADLDSKTNDSRTPLDLTEETEIIELIEELKTKEVKYPRKGKGVRRKRSNTCNSSIKRTSIHEKCVLSQTDTKAEGAALFKKLQSTEDTKASSPAEEPVSNTPAETLDGERQSTSSRDENNSSGYVSEGGQSDTRTEEKHELLKTSDISEKAEEKKAEVKVEDTENKDTNNLKVETQNKTSSIKQSPVPKPPRLGTLNSTSRLDPQAYINFEITPLDSNLKTSSNKPEADIKQDLSNTQSENVKPNKPVQNTELKTSTDENAKKEQNTEPLERLTTSTLPKLTTTDKRKAPEPPEVTANTKHAPLSKKASKKDPASEVQKVPTKNAVSYSNSAAANTTASPTTESKDEEKLLASKSSGRGFAFPRSRKTCCSVM